jgi:hypothetical protein
MKTTERITRLNDEMWLYEIQTEDPEIQSRAGSLADHARKGEMRNVFFTSLSW